MATTNRGSTIFKNVRSGILDFFGKRGDSINLNNQPGKDATPEEKIQALAKKVYGTENEYSTRASLAMGLELGTDRALAEAQLKLFDDTIEELKQAENIKHIEEAKELYKKITDSEKIVENTVKQFNDYINTLIESIEQNEIGSISVMIKSIDGKFIDYNAQLKNLEQNIKAYNDFVGKEEYVSSHSKINLTEEQIEKIYKGLKQQINSLENKRFVFGGRKKYITQYQDFIAKLESFCEDKDLFKQVTSRVDAELAKEEENPTKKSIQDAQVEIDTKINELFEQYKKEFKQLNKTIDNLIVNSEIISITKKYSDLTEEEKAELVKNGIEKFNNKIQTEYSEELVAAVTEATTIKELISELSKLEYTDPNFNTKFNELEARMSSSTTIDIFKKAGAIIAYDKNNLVLNVVFRREDLTKVNNLTIYVVPERIKSIIKGKPEIEEEKEITSAREKLSSKLSELVNTGPEKVDETAAKVEFETILAEFTKIPDTEKNKLLAEYIDRFKNANKGKNVDKKIEEILNKLFEEFKVGIKKFEFPVDKARIIAEVGQVIDDCREMAVAEKTKVLDKALNTFKQKVENEYGSSLTNTIINISEIKNKISELSKIDYKNPQFATKYQQLLDTIRKYCDSKEFKDAGVEIILDEENQIVTFNFHNDKINDISFDIVPEEIKKQIKRKEENPTQPEEQPDLEKEKQAAISDYIRLLEEVKNTILSLNECNKKIEAAASVSFDDFTSERIDSVVSLENSAMQFESRIIADKLELSNARANLRMKYNCYVNSLPEVKNFAMPKVEFGKEYKSFVEYYDEMITIAENKIKELDKERTAEYTPEDRVVTLTNEMKKLVNYIEAVNSLINRRIVAASLEEPIDIVAFLQERREHKKKIREEIKEMIEKEIASRPKVDQESAEKELTEELRNIYEEWLRQFKLSLSSETIVIDAVDFNKKINEAVEKSKVDKKYAIAENLKNEYAERRAQLENQYAEQTKTQNEVTSFLSEQITIIMKKIREGAEYEGEKLNELCLSIEINQKLDEIIKNSKAKNKEEIRNQATKDYLEKIKEIIEKEKIAQRRKFVKEIENTLQEIEALEMDDDFESKIIAKFNVLETQYGVTFNRVEIKYDIQDNKVEISYPYKEYNEKSYGNAIAHIEKTLLSLEKYSEYMEYLKRSKKTVQPEPKTEATTQPEKHEEPTQPEVTTQPEKQNDSKKKGKQLDIIIKDKKGLNFYSNDPQRVTREPNLIMTADAVELTLIKNGLRIKFSENLRAQLQELNAKLSLVNKDNYRSRTSTQIDTTQEEQEITFKKKDFEFDPEQYKIQIRTDRLNKDGKKLRGTDVIYETDINEEVSDRLKSGRTL